jgi:hypothetical protein
MPYNPDRVIDTLRLFIDLIDVFHLEDDLWTSGSEILRIISEYHRHCTKEGIAGDVFLWTLETLGPDLWQSFDEGALYSSMLWCLGDGQEERMQRLLELCHNVIDARDDVDGYSLLHGMVVERNPIPLLTMGANVNLVGFDPNYSPEPETPISLSMYRANTFVALQRALKVIGAKVEDIFDQALKECPLQYSHWTKETLVELFSKDLDLSPILYYQRRVCPFCLYERSLMVQPYWMRILDSIRSRTRSQSIQNVVETMLSTNSQSAAMSKDDHEKEEAYLHVQVQNQNSTDPEIEDEHLSDHDIMPISVRSDDEIVRGFNISDGISIEDEDICLFCWQEWRETGIKPSLDESKCLRCGQTLFSPACRGKGDYNELYCSYCSAKQHQADFAITQRQKRRPPAKVDSDKEQDHYSPYLIHT